ncbi:hypothetical protein [Pandoraea sputorum]|uniref:hypothetical protein n=1 Tax=Pandoraea sputorum TaxID=93222 RepID=UPI001240B499|nr:hypothetical protein [Pandoraea sputorum]
MQSVFQNPGGAEKIDATEVKKSTIEVSLGDIKDRGKLITGHGTYFDPKLKALVTGEFDEEGALKKGQILCKHTAEHSILWKFEVENKKFNPTPEQTLFGKCILPEYYATRPRFHGEVLEVKGDLDPATNAFWQALHGKLEAFGKVKEVGDNSETR